MMKGDVRIGRGLRQRALSKSWFCNNFKVATFGSTFAILQVEEHLETDRGLYDGPSTLSGCCTRKQGRHADIPIMTTFDRGVVGGEPPCSFWARSRSARSPQTGAESWKSQLWKTVSVWKDKQGGDTLSCVFPPCHRYPLSRLFLAGLFRARKEAVKLGVRGMWWPVKLEGPKQNLGHTRQYGPPRSKRRHTEN